jgi:hypothetical protein
MNVPSKRKPCVQHSHSMADNSDTVLGNFSFLVKIYTENIEIRKEAKTNNLITNQRGIASDSNPFIITMNRSAPMG